MDLLTDQKITSTKENNSLQSTDSAVGNLICKWAVSQGYVLSTLGCETGYKEAKLNPIAL